MPTFLNESVLSLPEQVEKNKNDIEEIKETIGGIEPDLVNQVHTNTSDISAIKQEQTLQNTAINNNTNKTQNINANGTKYSNVEEIKNELAPIQIKGNGVSIENDDATEIVTPNANINISNSGVVEISNDNNANKLKYNMANGDFTVEGSHTLKYNSATGDLTIDGGAVGATKVYAHSLRIVVASANHHLHMYDTDPTPVTTQTLLTRLLRVYKKYTAEAYLGPIMFYNPGTAETNTHLLTCTDNAIRIYNTDGSYNSYNNFSILGTDEPQEV